MSNPTSESFDLRQQLQAAFEHFEHVLPGQAPIKDFVHHNTLHGFQQQSFFEALKSAHQINGAYGYLPAEKFREYYNRGRITEADLDNAIDEAGELDADQLVAALGLTTLTRRDIYKAVLLHPFKPVTGCQLNWQLEEMDAFGSFQDDVPDASRERLLAEGRQDEPTAIADLWSAILEKLGLEHFILHPEELLDLSAEQAERMIGELAAGEQAETTDHLLVHRLVQKDSERQREALFNSVGDEITISGLLKAVTGYDLMDDIRPLMVRHLGNYLDQGVAAWHSQDRDKGFYHTWRQSALIDLAWVFEDMPDWQDQVESLPEDAMDTIVGEMMRLGLSEEHWLNYLERMSLELPGWSGMFLWRHLNPGYDGQEDVKVEMIDYLAVRLVLERLFAQRLCRKTWQVEASLDTLRWYFRRRRSEFYVRYALFSDRIPEYLSTRAQRLSDHYADDAEAYRQWQHLGDMIWTWRRSPSADKPEGYSLYSSAWPLFRLAQHLGLCGDEIRSLDAEQIETLFDCMKRLEPEIFGYVWLLAYERNYREEIFNALANNRGRGTWPERARRPEAQLVFCMDDREEGIRRYLEGNNPAIETLGAAAHFGVPHFWRGLDDDCVTGLTPVVLVPSHEIREVVQPGEEQLCQQHQQRRSLRIRARDALHQEIRRNLLSSAAAIAAAAPVALASLAGKIFSPRLFGQLADSLRRRFDMELSTNIELTAKEAKPDLSPDNLQQGFTSEEQVERVGKFLRTIGLGYGFAPLVVIMGHGSDSHNNPHIAAYNCGACSGNHSGPNARIFAAIANRPEARALLKSQYDIEIPDDCWFIGAEHNTCNESITWYDLDKIPESHRARFDKLDGEVKQAGMEHAHERCRKFHSAPADPTPEQALNHLIGRGMDFSQARPELGHATNAVAFIGRRSLSQGAFFDRRAFLISYDPTRDPDGSILEPLLLANGPVGAGINLEYYFSTVNNEMYGCSSKIMHNVTGFLGVMEGASSDLRTGLPRQMIEIHEAMRLLVVVEASVETLTEIYTRQPPLQELIGNGWLIVASVDPDSGEIALFKPDTGFVPWESEIEPLPTVKHTRDYYSGHMQPLPPVLIEKTEVEA
ncbi:MAG: DUF2309 domain-containing protein [Sedimenticola sp.]